MSAAINELVITPEFVTNIIAVDLADETTFTTADKAKLNGIEAGAQVNTVTRVAGKTGVVELDAGDIAYDASETYASGKIGAALKSAEEKLDTIEEGAEVNAVNSVNSKSGDVVLNAGDIGYDSSTAYGSGTVGKELSELNRQISDVEENQIPELKSAFTFDESNKIILKQGNLYVPTGLPTPDPTWCYAENVFKDVIINCVDTILRVFAYDYKDTYIGAWTGSEFTKTNSGIASLKRFVGREWVEAYNSYKFRLAFYKAGANITPDDIIADIAITDYVDEIEKDVTRINNNIVDGNFSCGQFANGQFTEGTGITDTTLRIYCTQEIKIHKGDKIDASAGTNTQPSILIVNSAKTNALQGTGWVETSTELISNYDGYLIALARYPDSSSILPSAYDSTVKVYNSFAYRVSNSVSENAKNISDTANELSSFETETKNGESIFPSETINTYASGWSSVDKCTAIGKGKAANQPYVEANKAANFYKMKVSTGFDPSIESSPANLYFAFDYSADSSYVPFDCCKEYSFMVTNTNNSTKFAATIRLCNANKERVTQFDVVLKNNKKYILTTDLTDVKYLMLYYFKCDTISLPFEVTFSDFVCKTRFSTNLKTFYDGNTKINKNSALSGYVGGRKIGSFPVSSGSYFSGLCMIHGDLFQFLTGDDAHTNYVKGAVFGTDIVNGTFYYKESFTDNFGHMNTVSYCEATDSLIFGNGSDDIDLPCKFYVYQGFYTAYKNGTRQFSISDCVEYDCSNISEFSGEIKMNAIWGDDDLLKYDQAILITNDNGTIRIVQLGKGTNQLSKGSYTASADGVFNGSFEIIKTYTQDVGVIPTESINVCIQDAEYRNGVIYAGIGHNHFEMWKMKLNDADNSVVTEKVLKHFRNADGTTTTLGGIAGIEVTNEYLILLLSPDYYYVYKL